MATATATAPAALRIAVDALERFITDALVVLTVSRADALTTAKVLATTDSWGVFTHGVKGLRGYIQRLQAGGLTATAVPAIVAEGPAWAMMDGQCAVAMVTSVAAMDRAISKARAVGVGYVGVRNSCHFGAAGYYATQAAEQGLIGLAMANDCPSMTIPGAKGRVLGNNPFAVAFPSRSGVVMLDMALSTVAGGKIMAAHFAGKGIPGDWMVDKDGQPSTVPKDFLDGGALTPAGGHKGYGLAVMVEVLAAVLTGAGVTNGVRPWMVDTATPTQHGAAFIALNIPSLMALDTFQERMEHLVQEIHEAPRRADCNRLYLPGEMERERRQLALRDGILLPADVADAVRWIAATCQLDLARYSGETGL